MHAPALCRRARVFASSCALALLSCSALSQPSTIDRVVIFGTSLSDSGNGFIWLSQPDNAGCGTSLNVPPYDALDDLMIPDGPYAKGGHHVSNGATWAEGMARQLALAGNARPAFANDGVKASNYAVFGARAFADYPCRFNLPAQVNLYLADFPQTSAHTLVAMEFGSNDVRDAFIAAVFGGDPATYLQRALDSVAVNVTMLHAKGARHFLLPNVPDIGKTPALNKLGPQATGLGNFLSVQYNNNLLLLTQQLTQALPGSDIRILDIYTKLNQIVASPGTYGFANASDGCVTPNVPPFHCTQPDSYVFWDGIHPTKATHAIFAKDAVAAISAP
jgi:outer membrane lipase/esterase